jgi:hypothetical protein
VLRRLYYPLDVMLLCVRWYVAYSLSLRNLEEMMAERGIEVDHHLVRRDSGVVVPLLVGFIVQMTGSYFLALMVFTAAGAGLFLCSILINYEKRVVV